MIDKSYNLHDLNIKTSAELEYFLDQIFIEAESEDYKLIRIITGRGNNSINKPLLKPETLKYLKHNKNVVRIQLEETLGSFVISLQY